MACAWNYSGKKHVDLLTATDANFVAESWLGAL
jgi:hypothetical protein